MIKRNCKKSNCFDDDDNIINPNANNNRINSLLNQVESSSMRNMAKVNECDNKKKDRRVKLKANYNMFQANKIQDYKSTRSKMEKFKLAHKQAMFCHGQMILISAILVFQLMLASLSIEQQIDLLNNENIHKITRQEQSNDLSQSQRILTNGK